MGNVVVESQDGASEEERRVERVGEVVEEGKGCGGGRNGDAIAFREIGRVESLLLGRISMVKPGLIWGPEVGTSLPPMSCCLIGQGSRCSRS